LEWAWADYERNLVENKANLSIALQRVWWLLEILRTKGAIRPAGDSFYSSHYWNLFSSRSGKYAQTQKHNACWIHALTAVLGVNFGEAEVADLLLCVSAFIDMSDQEDDNSPDYEVYTSTSGAPNARSRIPRRNRENGNAYKWKFPDLRSCPLTPDYITEGHRKAAFAKFWRALSKPYDESEVVRGLPTRDFHLIAELFNAPPLEVQEDAMVLEEEQQPQQQRRYYLGPRPLCYGIGHSQRKGHLYSFEATWNQVTPGGDAAVYYYTLNGNFGHFISFWQEADKYFYYNSCDAQVLGPLGLSQIAARVDEQEEWKHPRACRTLFIFRLGTTPQERRESIDQMLNNMRRRCVHVLRNVVHVPEDEVLDLDKLDFFPFRDVKDSKGTA